MPLTEKGEQIMEAMQEQYGKVRGERIFYQSENAGTIEGVHDQMSEPVSPTGSGFDNDVEERTCDEGGFPEADQMSIGDPGSTAAMTSTSPPLPTGDQPIVMPPEPGTMFEHPQLHPDASTPPEPALGADAMSVYGGIAGGLTDWNKDCFHDNWPAQPVPTVNCAESPGLPEITPDELVEQSRRYWGQME